MLTGETVVDRSRWEEEGVMGEGLFVLSAQKSKVY